MHVILSTIKNSFIIFVQPFPLPCRHEEKGQVLDPSVWTSSDPDLPTGWPAWLALRWPHSPHGCFVAAGDSGRHGQSGGRWVSSAHSELCFLAPSSKLCQICYATRGALFISVQLSIDAVSALWKAGVLIRLWKNLAPKHALKHKTHPPQVKKKFCLNSNDFGFIWAGVSNMVSYKTSVWYNLSCL